MAGDARAMHDGPGGKVTQKPKQSKRRATSYDVARAAGVAQSTVSRCFKDDRTISPATRERVLQVAAELGYSPNALARSLITRKSNMVGVIATEFTVRNNPELVYTLGNKLRAAGIGMFVQTIESDEGISSVLQQSMEFPLDGLICCAQMDAENVMRFQTHGIPVLFFNRIVAARHADCLSLDHTEAGRMVARALFAGGHRTIACIRGPEGAPVSKLRVNGFRKALAELGITHVPTCETDFSYDGGRNAFLDLLRGIPRPDAVFCANDQLALGVMDACRYDLGLRLPEDISVIGFDDIAEARRPSYALTTVRQPIAAMAEQAVALLLERIAEPDIPARRILLRGELITRASARIAPTDSSQSLSPVLPSNR